MPRNRPDQFNSSFRQWTRGITFNLALGKTQTATLVATHLYADEHHHNYPHGHKLLRHFIVAKEGLRERGLIITLGWTTPEEYHKRKKYKEFSRLTPAGELVIGLLKETGIYQELEKEFRDLQPMMKKVV